MSPASSPSSAARWFLLLGRVVLGVVFIYAAYTKLRQPWMLFAMSVNSYHLLPEGIVVFVARGLPWFELALGVLLIVGTWLRITSSISTALLAVFFGIMAHSFATAAPGEGISCGCFGLGEPISPGTLARDGALVALALAITVAAFLHARKAQSAQPSLED